MNDHTSIPTVLVHREEAMASVITQNCSGILYILHPQMVAKASTVHSCLYWKSYPEVSIIDVVALAFSDKAFGEILHHYYSTMCFHCNCCIGN